MKKVGVVVLFFFLLILFAGCQAEAVVPTEPTGDFSVTVEVLALDGSELFSEVVRFDSETDLNYVEILDDAIGLDYSMSEYGAFITGVAGIVPPELGVTYNFWFSILINDEMSWTGLDAVEVADGKKITFAISTMLDETDLWVDQVIWSFIDSKLSMYINAEQMHYGVVLALKQLLDYGFDVPTVLSLSGSEPTLLRDTISNAYKTTIFERVLNKNTEDTLTYLDSVQASNHYEAISLLYAHTMLGSTQTSGLIDMLISSTPLYLDVDYAGMVIAVLSHYLDYEGVAAFIETMRVMISDALTPTGVESWGSSNAASTAQVILGLVALGINPRNLEVDEETFDLISALRLYEIDAQFTYTSGDAQPDLAFSTPQVFAALVMYKLMRDTWGNPAQELHLLG